MLLLAVAGVLIPIWRSTREWCGWYCNCYLRSKRQYRQRRRKRKPFLLRGRLDLIQECARWVSAMGSGSRSELNASYTGYYCAYSNAEGMLKRELEMGGSVPHRIEAGPPAAGMAPVEPCDPSAGRPSQGVAG